MSDDNNDNNVASNTGGNSGNSDNSGNSGNSDNGALILRGPNGHFLPGTRPPNLITSANARDMVQARRDKTARLIRDELGKRAGVPAPLAVAMAAGDLWDQIVSNPDANARYRLETWRGVAGAAELLADRRADAGGGGVNIEIGADLARQLVDKLLRGN